MSQLRWMKPSLSCLPNQSWLRSRRFTFESIASPLEAAPSHRRRRNIYTAAPFSHPFSRGCRMSVDRRDSSAALTGGASYPSLRGRSVFITGGGSGIGGVMTEAFAAQGSLVAFVDVNEALSQALVQKIEKAGHPRPWFRKADVTDVPGIAGRDPRCGHRAGRLSRAGQQRGQRRAPQLPGRHPRVLRRAHRGKPAAGVLRNPGGGARHEEDGRRIHHQFRLQQLRRQGPQHVRCTPPRNPR